MGLNRLPFHATDIHIRASTQNTESRLIDTRLPLTMGQDEKSDRCKMNVVLRADGKIRIVPEGFLLAYIAANELRDMGQGENAWFDEGRECNRCLTDAYMLSTLLFLCERIVTVAAVEFCFLVI